MADHMPKETTSKLKNQPKFHAVRPTEQPIETLKDGADSVAEVSKVNAPHNPKG